MQSFKNLKVWNKSHNLVLQIYKISEQFPRKEELTSQMIRAVSSISMNIAEGCGKSSLKEYLRFINISISSTTELEYQIMLSKDLRYIDHILYEELTRHVIEVRKMLLSLRKSLNR